MTLHYSSRGLQITTYLYLCPQVLCCPFLDLHLASPPTMIFLFLLTLVWHNFRCNESCQKWKKKEKECPCVLHADSRHYPDLCPALSLHAAPHLHAFFWRLWGISSSSILFTSSSFPPKAGGTQVGWLPEGPPLCLGPALQDSLDSESPVSWAQSSHAGFASLILSQCFPWPHKQRI